MVKAAAKTLSSKPEPKTPARNLATKRPRVALVLQGGGALGAYHIGAYQALEEAGYRPDWVSGISIGAINSALIAGNRPEHRLERLEELWFEISRPDEWGAWLCGDWRKAFNQMSAATSIFFGQPNFWFPRIPSPMLLPHMAPESASFCDTSPMLSTLHRLTDFDLINSKATRLSLGATCISTGNLEFFDNTQCHIEANHVLASGSLPPGFPATRVGNKLYWDGGCVSNTPLDAIYQDKDHEHTLVFMIDLWSAAGPAPTTMDEVNWRQKQIQYASRSSRAIQTLATEHNLRCALKTSTTNDPAVPSTTSMRLDQNIDIVHIVYHPSSDQISQSDAEFSRPSITERRTAGYHDMKLALSESPWTKHTKKASHGTVVHRVKQGEVKCYEFC